MMPKIGKKTDGDCQPTVRLAVSDDGMPSKLIRYPKALSSQTPVDAPVVRLARTTMAGRAPQRLPKIFPTMEPTVRLAHVPGAQGDNNLLGQRGVESLPDDLRLPALLVSYYYLEGFSKRQSEYRYRDWMMDSGAYSAYNSGKVIDLDEYIQSCHILRATDASLKEIIALDVIGSGPESLVNAHKMRDAGVDCIPVFHIGDDWAILKEYCELWDKVGISCRFGESLTKSYWFYDQCFARHWPKKFHSFGWADEKVLQKYPIHSSDSSSWETGPCGFGNWKFFGKMSVRGSTQNLRTQVEWYLELEERLRERWKKEMMELESLPCLGSVETQVEANAVRLVVGSGRSVCDPGLHALGEQKGKKGKK